MTAPSNSRRRNAPPHRSGTGHTVKQTASIDWTVSETVRAKLRIMVKRILRKYRHPPDKQEKATVTVLKQAELLCADWAA
jgi:type I restriction enzyme, R subunit